MGAKKLTEKELRAKLRKEKRITFLKQQISIHSLSQLSDHILLANTEENEQLQTFGPNVANQGLSTATEHAVITRTSRIRLPHSQRTSASPKKNKSNKRTNKTLEPKGWDVIEEEEKKILNSLGVITKSKGYITQR